MNDNGTRGADYRAIGSNRGLPVVDRRHLFGWLALLCVVPGWLVAAPASFDVTTGWETRNPGVQVTRAINIHFSGEGLSQIYYSLAGPASGQVFSIPTASNVTINSGVFAQAGWSWLAVGATVTPTTQNVGTGQIWLSPTAPGGVMTNYVVYHYAVTTTFNITRIDTQSNEFYPATNVLAVDPVTINWDRATGFLFANDPYLPDEDEDGIPDETDPDDDGDGIPDINDPDHPDYQPPDGDGDGDPDETDPDDDNDGTPDPDDPDHPDYEPPDPDPDPDPEPDPDPDPTPDPDPDPDPDPPGGGGGDGTGDYDGPSMADIAANHAAAGAIEGDDGGLGGESTGAPSTTPSEKIGAVHSDVYGKFASLKMFAPQSVPKIMSYTLSMDFGRFGNPSKVINFAASPFPQIRSAILVMMTVGFFAAFLRRATI